MSFPEYIRPQQPNAALKPPEGSLWLHEIKYDGYRALARVSEGRSKILTRRGYNWTARFRAVAQELTTLPIQDAMFDGEMVARRADGTSSFTELHTVMDKKDQSRLHYYIFDLLHLNGQSILHLPLIERKNLLKEVLPENLVHISYVDHMIDPGPDLMKHACALGAEGVVSKRIASRYRSGNNNNWLKIKCYNQQEVVIGGFLGNDKAIILLAGYYQSGKLQYAGKIGLGISQAMSKVLFGALSSLESSSSFFEAPPTKYRNPHWTKPRLVAQVKFLRWTNARTMSHASFQGIREDKKPSEVIYEIPKPG